jgi:hypothetical protein
MALTVNALIDEVAIELNDVDNTRWTRLELLGYFNAAQRALAAYRPDQLAQERELALVAGWRQLLPGDVLTLIDITNNANASARRITKTDAWVLDAVASGWRGGQPGREVVHFMHDMRVPQEFLVYPPVVAGVKVRVVVEPAVADLVSEGEAPAVPDRWMDALRHFVLFRAWSKDAEFGGNAALAASHLELFHGALGVQSKAAQEVAPTV